nr:restriction endonuclease subunit S [uncultured Psychroserpens sp.]
MVEVENKIQRYESYKDSGVEWLGEIPEHWELKRFKFLAESNKGKLPSKIVSINDNDLPPYMSMEYLRGGEENQWVKDNDAFVIDENEILLLWDGSNSGEFLKSRKGVISSTVAHIIFSNINKDFAWYHSKVLEIELRKNTIGMGIPHVSGRVLNNLTMLLPPPSEQAKIAQFLDDKTTKIDEAIAIKQQQINLLKERKQILIHKAVTRGLDDSVALKDSGVEWIGEIPEHWEVKKMTYVCKIDTGATPDRSNSSYWEGNIPWIKTGEVNYDVINTSEEFITEKGLKNSATRLAPVGTILMAMYGQGVTRGRVSLLGIQATYNQACCAMLFNKEIYNKYAYYFFVMAYSFIRDGGNETSQMNISAGYISGLKILQPPLSEQKEISAYIESASQKIERAIGLKLQEIDKLKEYKSSLINGVVTGKVRVC